MSTLAALHRAVVASPEDRTVRLVYADALDETGDADDAARAEFIRTQIELQSTPEPQRRSARNAPAIISAAPASRVGVSETTMDRMSPK